MTPADLDAALRQLLDPAAPWQFAKDVLIFRDRSGAVISRLPVATRYRQRPCGPYLLSYTPAGEYSPAADLALSRHDGQSPSRADVQALVNSLARVLARPYLEVVVLEMTVAHRPARRLYLPLGAALVPSASQGAEVYQAVVYDRNERYEEEWLSLGITTSHEQAAAWLRRDQQRWLLRGQVISYQLTPAAPGKEVRWQPGR